MLSKTPGLTGFRVLVAVAMIFIQRRTPLSALPAGVVGRDHPPEVEAARLLTLRAAAMKDAGQSAKVAASMAKVFASEVAMKAATQSLQIHGGAGYITEFPIERIFRDAKLTEIGEGTSEVQRMVIARDILGARSQP